MHLAPAYVLADTGYAGTADLANRVEVRGRDTQGSLGLDVADVPTARIDLTNRRWEYLLDYSALAELTDLEMGFSPQLLQVGQLGVSWRDRRVRIGITEYAEYGYENSAYVLSGQPNATVPSPTIPVGGGTQLLAAPVTLLYGSSRTVLDSRFELSRRWSGTASIEYDMEGGLDAASRLVLPFTTGPRADASASYALTRVDTLRTRASALESTASSTPCEPEVIGVPANSECDPAATEGTVTEEWDHHLSRTWTSTLGAGAAYVRARLMDTRPYEQFVYPVALASVERATGPVQNRTVLRLETLLAPVLDVRIGLLDERAQAFLDLSQQFGHTRVIGIVSAARSVESPFMQPVTLFEAWLEADVALSPIVSLGGGIQYAWQEEPVIGTFWDGFVFASVTVRAPQLRF